MPGFSPEMPSSWVCYLHLRLNTSTESLRLELPAPRKLIFSYCPKHSSSSDILWLVEAHGQQSQKYSVYVCQLLSRVQLFVIPSARLLCPWDSSGKNTRVGCHSLLQGIFQAQGSNPSLLHCGQILYHLSHQGSPQSVYAVLCGAQSLSCARLFGTPWTVACQAPLSMGFFRQEYWSGLPCPLPGDHPNPGIKPRSPSLQAISLPAEPQGKWYIINIICVQSGLPRQLCGEEYACQCRDVSSIPGSGRFPGEGNGNPLQYSCLGNHGQRSLVGCSPSACKDSDMTQRLSSSRAVFSLY